MSKFIISEDEKRRILKMHQNATTRQYLSEAPTGATPTSTTATKEPPYLQLNYGHITVGISYGKNVGVVTVQGSSKMPDGTYRTLKSATNAPTNIDSMVQEFMSKNGLQPSFMVAGQTERFKDALKTKLTEMNNNVQTYLKSIPSQR